MRAMRRFVTIDPGLGASGYAYWADDTLVRCGLLRSRPKTKALNERIAEQHAAWLALYPSIQDAECVISERMVHRHIPRRGKKGVYIDPQDLINVSLVAGRLATRWVAPSVWKGSVPRDVEQDHTRSALTPEELALVEAVLPESLRKEAYSAVGIGLSILKRAHQKCGWGLE